MSRFASGRDAKEFLVARIVVEAQREGVSLAEIERKMLYFSETDWTLPDIDKVSEAFEREYDNDEYEKKIRSLIHNARVRARKEDEPEFEALVGRNPGREQRRSLPACDDRPGRHIHRFTRALRYRNVDPRDGSYADPALKGAVFCFTPIGYQAHTGIIRLFRLADSCHNRGRRGAVVLPPGLGTNK